MTLPYELPPLPNELSSLPPTISQSIRSYAHAAIEGVLGRRGEPVGEETLWCLHILGPDDVHPAPSKAYAEVAADLHNTRFRKPSKDSGVMCKAVVAPWPHDAESHARGLANFVSNWITPQPAEPVAPFHGKVERHSDQSVLVRFPSCRLASEFERNVAAYAEPVKVPSDAELFALHDEYFPTMVLGHDNYLSFARALLARYGQPTDWQDFPK